MNVHLESASLSLCARDTSSTIIHQSIGESQNALEADCKVREKKSLLNELTHGCKLYKDFLHFLASPESICGRHEIARTACKRTRHRQLSYSCWDGWYLVEPFRLPVGLINVCKFVRSNAL